MNRNSEELLDIGVIVGTHGLRGDLKVRLNSEDSDILLTVDQVFLHLPSGELHSLEIVRQVLHKGQVLLRFREHESISRAEWMIGGRVLVSESSLPQLAEDEYYWGQLKGLAVIDRDRGDLGCLKDIYSTAAHDTYVVKGKYGEVLIPVVKEFVLAIDLDGGVIQVAVPNGLIPDES